MQILHRIIHSMNKEEIRAFKLFIDRIQTSGDRKVTQLFDLIKKNNKELSNDEILKKLPDIGNLNALYQLRKRLRRYIDHSQHAFFFANNPELESLQLYQLGKQWFLRQEYKLAGDYFEKAGKIAENHQLLDILELVYTGLINSSLHLTDINPQHYIDLRKQNLKKLSSIKALDELLTSLSYKLSISQQTEKKNEQTTHLLQQTLEDFAKMPEISTSPAMRLRLTEGLAGLLLQEHKYNELADFLENSMYKFELDNVFNEYNHELKLKLQTWLTNAYFKSGKINESIKAAGNLRSSMLEYDSAYYDKYFIFYNSALIYANTINNMPEAIRILRDTIRNPLLAKHPIYSLIVNLNLALCLFESKEFKPAMKQIASLQRHDAYMQADDNLRLKIEFSELIMRAEGDEWDTVLIRGNQIQKDYSENLNARKAMCDLLNILLRIARKDGLIMNQTKDEIKQWLITYKSHVPESQVIDIYEWVKKKYQFQSSSETLTPN